MRRFTAGVLVWLCVLASPSFLSAQTKLVIGVPHRVLFDVALPMYVAQEKGFFKDEGLTIEPVFVKGGGENVQAVITGDVNIGLATGPFAILTAFVKGAPVTVVSAEMTGMPDLFWYALETSPIRKVDDIAGKKIAYSNSGSSTHMAVLAMIEQIKAKGLKAPEDIALGSPPDTFTAVKTGQADLGWSTPPLFFDRLDKEIRIVFRGNDVVKLRDVTVRVNFVNADFAKKNPDAVKKFFRAYQKALDFIFDKREETAKIWIKRADLKIPESLVLKSWDFFSKQSMALKPIKGIQATIEDAIKFNFLKQPLTQAELDKLIDLRFVP